MNFFQALTQEQKEYLKNATMSKSKVLEERVKSLNEPTHFCYRLCLDFLRVVKGIVNTTKEYNEINRIEGYMQMDRFLQWLEERGFYDACKELYTYCLYFTEVCHFPFTTIPDFNNMIEVDRKENCLYNVLSRSLTQWTNEYDEDRVFEYDKMAKIYTIVQKYKPVFVEANNGVHVSVDGQNCPFIHSRRQNLEWRHFSIEELLGCKCKSIYNDKYSQFEIATTIVEEILENRIVKAGNCMNCFKWFHSGITITNNEIKLTPLPGLKYQEELQALLLSEDQEEEPQFVTDKTCVLKTIKGKQIVDPSTFFKQADDSEESEESGDSVEKNTFLPLIQLVNQIKIVYNKEEYYLSHKTLVYALFTTLCDAFYLYRLKKELKEINDSISFVSNDVLEYTLFSFLSI